MCSVRRSVSRMGKTGRPGTFWCSCTILLLLVSAGSADQIVVTPHDDGYVYVGQWGQGIATNTYVYADAEGSRGVIEFSTAAIPALPIESAYLAVNPYALPVFDLTLAVYAYESEDGILTVEDHTRGQYLGTCDIPADIGFGEDIFFDVSAFLRTVDSPYVGFNLRVDTFGSDSFSSLEYHYGHPSQLIVSTMTVPAPAAVLLGGLGAGLAGWLRRRSVL